MSLADDIAAARKAFSDGVRHHDTASAHKERAEALTDLLWANLDEIVVGLRFAPSDWAELQRNAFVAADDAATIRRIVERRSLTLLDWEKATLRAIADKMDTPHKPTIEDLENAGRRLIT